MKLIASKMKELWKDESAQGATEYILILVFVVSLALIFGKDIQKKVRDQLTKLGGGLDQVTVTSE